MVNVSSAQTVLPRPGWRRIDKLAAAADDSEWQLIEAGPSQTGSRWWQWWVRRIADPEEPVGSAVRGQPWPSRWMIARRRPETPDDLDYYLAWGPSGTPPEHLAHVAGARWRVEDAIKLGKHQCGLADYEVRHWHGWYRHITLSMPAAAFLAVQAATDDADAPAPLREALSGDEPDEEPKGGARGHHQPRTAHPLHRGRDPQAPYAHPPATPTRARSGRPRTVVVTLATTSPGRRQRASSQTPDSRTRPELQLKGLTRQLYFVAMRLG